MKKQSLIALICLLLGLSIQAQTTKSQSQTEADSLVLKKLDWWQDQKFGILMHWGTYSTRGIVESWSICPEDWIERSMNDYNQYRQMYEGLRYAFNPLNFTPEKWAKAARKAGLRYMVFTTKHHDGFCMFDSKLTDYKVTDKDCPFSVNKRANITKEIFDAFRKEGLGIGAYFSKPDWNNKDYWAPEFPPLDRNVNYNPKKYPQRWKKFCDFTYNQIEELMSSYGKVDLLWLDGGWVRPIETQTEESKSWCSRIVDQDIDMAKISGMARKKQPGLIVVDRSVHGKFENYRTPEQEIPDKPLPYLWETCMTMGNSWSWVPNEKYKPTRKLIHLLVDIVAKGGNFLMGVAPDPTGELDDTAYLRLKEIGEWMDINSEAIYNTRAIAPYKDGKVCFTKGKNGTTYALYLCDENEKQLPAEIELPSFKPEANSTVIVLGGPKVNWKAKGKGCVITIPAELRTKTPCNYVWVFKFVKS